MESQSITERVMATDGEFHCGDWMVHGEWRMGIEKWRAQPRTKNQEQRTPNRRASLREWWRQRRYGGIV